MIFWTTHDHSREVSPCPDISEVGKNLAFSKDISDAFNLRTDHSDVMGRCGTCLRNDCGGSRAHIDKDFLFECVNVVLARKENLRLVERLFRPLNLANSAVDVECGLRNVWVFLVSKTNEPSTMFVLNLLAILFANLCT